MELMNIDSATIDAVKTMSRDDATALYVRVREQQKLSKEDRERVTAPMLQALEEVRSRYRPYDTALTDLANACKGRLLEIDNEMTVRDKAIAKVIDKQEGKKVKYRNIQVVNIVDAGLIPRQFLVPNDVAIKTALLAGTEVAGCELVEKRIASL